MAAKAGAAVAIIMGISDDDTVRESVRAGKKYGCEVMVDLLGCADKPRRARELEELGVDYLCVHVGIDEQMAGGTPFETVRRVAEASALPVAAAGGINSETAAEAVRSGASIVIVGGAISKSPNVAESTRLIMKAILTARSSGRACTRSTTPATCLRRCSRSRARTSRTRSTARAPCQSCTA